MRKTLQHFFSLLILVTISGFGLMNHVSAMPASMHQMNHDSTHAQHSQSSNAARCVTLCTSAVVTREDELKDVTENEDNDEPVVPFYVLYRSSIYDNESISVALTVASVKPPPKVPIYILYSVFRA